MKKLFLLFVLAFTIPISAQVEKIYFKDGVTLKETGNLKNGFKDGKWEEFYENGKLKTTGNYTNDERNGEWKIYFDNGKVAAVGNYTSTKFPTPGTWKFFSKEGEKISYQYPIPTSEQFSNVCVAIYQREPAKNSQNFISYGYQQDLWDMSDAKTGLDNFDVAMIKIQMMWNLSRQNFRCYNYTNLVASEKNIMKFSLDSGFTTLLTEAVKRFQLDMNFLDPADNKTILDFIQDREIHVLNTMPIDREKASEYHKIYNLLKTNGAKHSWELK